MTGLARLLGALHRAHVEFIVVGGVAAQAHGSARVTQDVDVSYSRTEDNLRRVLTALRPFKPYLRGAPRGLPFEWSEATLRAGLNFTLTTTVARSARREMMREPHCRVRPLSQSAERDSCGRPRASTEKTVEESDGVEV